MEAVGLIAEYNPLHKAHKAQLELIKSAFPHKPVICVMSGNFVQRGEPAVFNKYVRTRAALNSGVAMVIELPVCFSTASAEYFAHYAVNLLNSTGIVSNLCFGSEAGELSPLVSAAEILAEESEEFKAMLKLNLQKGLSYPVARKEAFDAISQFSANILDSPNNILGIEYIKAIIRLGSKIQPFTTKRQGEAYHSSDYTKPLSSATAIRSALSKNEYEQALKVVPENIRNIYNNEIQSGNLSFYDSLSQLLQYRIKTMPDNELREIADVDEGLENRIIRIAGENMLISQMLEQLKSKRYTYTKLSRALLHIILNITKHDLHEYITKKPPYMRVLGFKREYEYLFKEIEANSDIPILTNLKNSHKVLDERGMHLLEKEVMSTDIYYLTQNRPMRKNAEYSQPMVIV